MTGQSRNRGLGSPLRIDPGLPACRQVAGLALMPAALPTLGHDDAPEFVGDYGGLYVTSGAQDVEPADNSRSVPGAMVRVIG
ncbi:hypothetical protein NBRGN_057_02050 [Nocardia brasiliensis NBRC 14402]|uniref:hypothetical protein n=1 Tax=Nocardia brasiliensis TaxID=37326 RepID=UPI00045C5AC6|nr:hypothetical protein [Nocardia brasiliensis]ASF11609.1 hypothetical protein CEQ30_34520 [Nocardia brasiliensis]GAJ82699.1 hypothetical protein NBRGN_057_02050 [Nocardia brasiliensis NBRC 14402]SUB09600.1 Uncharacterised protein [Nocardia brasiliensis]